MRNSLRPESFTSNLGDTQSGGDLHYLDVRSRSRAGPAIMPSNMLCSGIGLIDHIKNMHMPGLIEWTYLLAHIYERVIYVNLGLYLQFETIKSFVTTSP